MKPRQRKEFSPGRLSLPMLVRALKLQVLFLSGLFVFGYWPMTHIPGERQAYAQNLLSSYPAQNKDGTLNAVIEIPAGTNEKWEFSTEEEEILLEQKGGKPRIVAYLGYPGNYGMIPQTILSKEKGGDGDPLDVLVIGGPLERGDVARVKLIGVLKFLDRGEQDDKLIAVLPGTALGTVHDFDELDASFPGALEIITTWFRNYKGPGKMEFLGRGSLDEAADILHTAAESYQNQTD